MSTFIHLIRWLGIASHCSSDEVLRVWMRNPLNQWVCSDPVLFRALFVLLNNCRPNERKNLLRQKIIFARSNGNVSCLLSIPKSCHVVLIFPQLQAWLAQGETRLAEAVIAHELGHLLAGHHERSIPMIKAQCEADAFAANLGYAPEINELLKREKSQEARERAMNLSVMPRMRKEAAYE